VEAAMEGKNRQLSPIENISINTKVLNQHSNDDILQISLRYYIIMPWECPALGPSWQWLALSEKKHFKPSTEINNIFATVCQKWRGGITDL
jgi:hypothetical protein